MGFRSIDTSTVINKGCYFAILKHIFSDVFVLQSLSHCELITDDGIRHLSNSPCGHERLQIVELDNCPLITDVTLEHLKSCHNLERIELYDCQQVTRAGIKRIRVKSNFLSFILAGGVFKQQKT